jgi:hypothetical protein
MPLFHMFRTGLPVPMEFTSQSNSYTETHYYGRWLGCGK